MKRTWNGRELIENINQLPSDILRSIFSFCKDSCANLVCKKWKDLYSQVYKNQVYGIDTFKSEKLMFYLLGIRRTIDVKDRNRRLWLFEMASSYSSVNVLKYLYYGLDCVNKDDGENDSGLGDIGLAIINSLDMDKIYWFFDEIKLIDLEKGDDYDYTAETLIEKVIDAENFTVLDFLNSSGFCFLESDLEYAVKKGKLTVLKYFLSLEGGEYNLSESWVFSCSVEYLRYDIINYLLTRPYGYDLFKKKDGYNHSDVEEASYKIGRKFNTQMILYLHKIKHFNPIRCIAGILAASGKMENIELIKELYSLSNQDIIKQLPLCQQDYNDDIDFVNSFKSLYHL